MSKSPLLPSLSPCIMSKQRLTRLIDYCVAAFGIVFIISAFQWIVDGRKNFVGPRMDVDPLEGEVAVNVAPSTADHKQEGQK